MSHEPRQLTITYPGGKQKHLRFIPGSDQQFVSKEVLIDECYGLLGRQPNDTVLNIGGHIGSFDVYCYDKVNKIITCEPHPETYAELEYNLQLNDIKNVITANTAVGRYTQEGRLYIGQGQGHNSTHCYSEGAESIDMGQWGIEDIFTAYPEISKIKCDCEGAEIDIFKDFTIPASVKGMIFETHDEAVGKENIDAMIEDFKSQGFTCQLFDNDHLARTQILVCQR